MQPVIGSIGFVATDALFSTRSCKFFVVECGRFPLTGKMAFKAISFCELMQCIFRLLLFVTGDTVVPELKRERCVPERFGSFFGDRTFVIGMAIDTGVVGKAFMKESLVGIFFENGSSDSFVPNVTLFMTTDALN